MLRRPSKAFCLLLWRLELAWCYPIAVSHPWLSPGHPDPFGHHAREIAAWLESKDHDLNMMFFDFLSLLAFLYFFDFFLLFFPLELLVVLLWSDESESMV